jgi:hypothetical protein
MSSTTDMLAKNVKRDPASIQIPFRYSEGAEGGTRTPTDFPTIPSRCRSLAVTGARASFSIQHLLVQLDYFRRRPISPYTMSEVIPPMNFTITSQSIEKGATACAVTP